MGACEPSRRGALLRPVSSFAARLALALLLAVLSQARTASAAGPTPAGAVGLLGLADPADIAAESGLGDCSDVIVAPPGTRRAGLWPLACGALPFAPLHELKLTQGEASWSLGVGDANTPAAGRLHASFGWNHAITLGAFGDWRLDGNVSLSRADGAIAVLPVLEATRFSLGRSLPNGWDLRLDASASAIGAFDPAAAVEQTGGYAAELRRRFRLAPFAADHTVSLRLARDSTVSPACGIDQQSMLARFGYLHPLALGTLGASFAWSRTEATGAPEQGATRTELSYAFDF